MRIKDNLTCRPGIDASEADAVTPEAALEVLSSTLAVKDAQQRAAVREVIDRLRGKLPNFKVDPENAVDLYPIHPYVFTCLFKLPTILPGFSAMRFLRDAIPAAAERLEEQMVTLDQLFDFILPELKNDAKFAPLLSSYENFRANVLHRFTETIRPRVEALLKAIAFSTLCDTHPADVVSLANSLLLQEDSDFLPSYSLTAALLTDMEQEGGIYLMAEGEKLGRTYRLLEVVDRPAISASRELLERESELRRKLSLLVYDWIRTEIPTWKPDLSPKYETSSQSLVAPVPEGERQTAGLVYFKSVQDPFWSEEDIQALEASGYQWVLVILSPLESPYETDSALGRTHSERILTWRPDKPTREEIERLQGVLSTHPALGVGRPDAAAAEARDCSRRVLRALYIDRGRLATSGDQWSIGGEIEARTLSQYLAAHLAALVSLAPPQPSDRAISAQPLAEDLPADEGAPLRLCRLLAGLEERDVPDKESARERLLEWWDSVLKTEAAFSSPEGSLPDSFMTTQFLREVKPTRNHLQAAKPILESLRRSESTLDESLAALLRQFGAERSRLLEWADDLLNLARLVRWLPAFDHAKDYVLASFPLGHDKVDEQRAALRDSIFQPHIFLRPSERDNFDRTFLVFKSAYIDHYLSAHDETLNVISPVKSAEGKIDAAALQSLELLSNLLYTDKSYLNRVRILGKWILRNQCLLPVREILESYPRCYCNFNPAGNREFTKSAGQIDALIQEGIEYFRNVLRLCSKSIIEDLRVMKVDDFHSRQIAALISHGRLVPIKPRTIEVLNKIIEAHSAEFLSAINIAKRSSVEFHE